MHRYCRVLWILLALLALPQFAFTAGDLSKQEPMEVTVNLGSQQNELSFSPKNLTFETGKLYKLILKNPSPQKHYFTSLGFASAVWTRKVEDDSMEVKGAITEIEVMPGKSAVWFFVPVQAGAFELYCRIPGHKEGGMAGSIDIK